MASRGFEGAVGNILINGARPASKNDAGSSVLSRTLVAQVERIELIRGGAPGIDMQGYSVVVNVITKTQSSVEHILTGTAFLFEGGTDAANGSYQFTARTAIGSGLHPVRRRQRSAMPTASAGSSAAIAMETSCATRAITTTSRAVVRAFAATTPTPSWAARST